MAGLRIGFVIEQALGHAVYGRNLRAVVADQPGIAASWILPRRIDRGPLSLLPLIRSNWTLQAGLQARRGLARIATGDRLQALLFHTQVTATLAQDWLSRAPSIVSLDATPMQYDALGSVYAHRRGPAWLEKGKWRLNRRCFDKARRIVAWSAWAKQGLIADYGVSEDKIRVIPPGVDVQGWSRPTDLAPAGTEACRILFVGGNLERKGGRVLLEAFRVLRREAQDRSLPPLELVIVTQDLLPEEPGVQVCRYLAPNSAALRTLYWESHIFCVPTRGDMLPLALAEAGGAGLPLVSTHVGAISELVQEGRTGHLVPAGEVAPLVETLRALISRPERRLAMGRAAAALVRKRHNCRQNALELLCLLEEVARERRPDGTRSGLADPAPA
jgi:glycosyltransferase involved in cell wall biosynthesis